MSTVESDKVNKEDNTKINVNVILSYGTETARVIMEAYFSKTAKDKLIHIERIAKLTNIKDEAKVKFIGDVMIRPKYKRIFIAMKLKKRLEAKKDD